MKDTTTKKPRKPGSGGSRPGAGRHPRAGGPLRPVSFRLSPEAREDIKVLRAHKVNVTRAIEREIHRLATAYDLADVGII